MLQGRRAYGVRRRYLSKALNSSINNNWCLDDNHFVLQTKKDCFLNWTAKHFLDLIAEQEACQAATLCTEDLALKVATQHCKEVHAGDSGIPGDAMQYQGSLIVHLVENLGYIELANRRGY